MKRTQNYRKPSSFKQDALRRTVFDTSKYIFYRQSPAVSPRQRSQQPASCLPTLFASTTTAQLPAQDSNNNNPKKDVTASMITRSSSHVDPNNKKPLLATNFPKPYKSRSHSKKGIQLDADSMIALLNYEKGVLQQWRQQNTNKGQIWLGSKRHYKNYLLVRFEEDMLRKKELKNMDRTRNATNYSGLSSYTNNPDIESQQ